MRWSVAVALLAVACAGCGGSTRAVTTTLARPTPKARVAPYRVGVVGPLSVHVARAAADRRPLRAVADDPLVLVDARVQPLGTVATVAAAHPASHFALVGASTKDERVANLVGLVLRDDTAARLAGAVAALVASSQGGAAPRVAWVGPEERKVAAAFGRGVRDAAPSVSVLHQWSRSDPARCKEAALTAIDRGAVVVAAHRGLCAVAAASGAHERNVPALAVGDFELPSVAAALLVRDALGGVYHGGEDIVFGATTGAIGVRRLDPLIPADVAAQARATAQDLLSAG
jgi:basic membrane lipoprotein Med (substrate-binding protein (PBP1-ABC) superfamily)